MWRNKSSKSTHCFVKHFPVHMEPCECQQVPRGTSDATTLSSLIDCCCGYCSFGVSPPLTSTAGVHQMRHSFIIIIIIDVVVVIVVSHLKSFQPQNSRFPSFKNNTGRTDGWTDQRTDGWTDMTSYRDAWTHLKTAILVVQK